MMIMRWERVTPEHYDAARRVVNWEGDVPKGQRLHIAGFDAGGLRVTDVWDSAEDFHRFVEMRLIPGIKRLGIAGEPQVEIVPLYLEHAPAYG